MEKLISWYKTNSTLIITLFLTAFIPLYPKIPLFDIVQTWVYIRLEDVLVAFAATIYIVSRGKPFRFTNSPLTLPILSYWSVGLIVLLWSLLFTGPKLLNFFPHLAVLHYLRRIEYMIVFFLALGSIRKESTQRTFIWVLAATVFATLIYGLGQKFLGFPAFLTMNEEFAKGIPLRLPPTARIPSTFGGHYDFAAFLVLVIPILGSLVFGLERLWQKIIFLGLAVGSVVLLLLTASRISFGVYLVAITMMLIWQKKYIFIPIVILASFILLSLVSGASERFYKTFRFSDVIVDLSTGKPIGTLEKLEGGSAVVEKQESPAKENLPKGSGFINVPPQSVRGSPEQTIQTIEVYRSAELASGSGEVATISGSFLIQKALVYDISITTRFQGQWPKALEAFQRNILLGSGFSTLSVASDGDYLRMLGESGIIGTIAFLGIFLAAFYSFFARINKLSQFSRSFTIGVFASLVGLLLNAVLIDVFEASKVAFLLWIILGAAFGVISAKYPFYVSYKEVLQRFFTSSFAYQSYLVLLILFVFRSALSIYFIGDDFTWLRWAGESSVESISTFFTDATGFFYRPIPKVWYFVLFSVFWLKPWAYHVMSLVLYSLIVLFLYRILRAYVRPAIAWWASATFAVLSIHHENVFWISGHSSLLAAASLFGSLAMLEVSRVSKHHFRRIGVVLAICGVFLSMLSYDGMLIAPVLVAVIGVFLWRRPITVTMLLLIPLYWYLRTHAHALLPSGDYGYNVGHLFVNTIGNTVTYLGGVFVGPSGIDVTQTLRAALRSEGQKVVIASFCVVISIIALSWRSRRSLWKFIPTIVWAIVSLISLAPYLGLGGASERYALLFSGFVILCVATAFEIFVETYRARFVILAFPVIITIMLYNMGEVDRLALQWKKASDVVEQSLLTVKKEFFPLRDPKAFVFMDIPIRYGRAWIYPTGMGDALWHMFRYAPYTYGEARSLPDAYSITVAPGYSKEVLRFENLRLKKVIREVMVINEEK